MFIIYCSSPLSRTLAPWGRHCCQVYLYLNPKHTRPELACNRHSVDMTEWMNIMTKSNLTVLIPRKLPLNSTLEYTISLLITKAIRNSETSQFTEIMVRVNMTMFRPWYKEKIGGIFFFYSSNLPIFTGQPITQEKRRVWQRH